MKAPAKLTNKEIPQDPACALAFPSRDFAFKTACGFTFLRLLRIFAAKNSGFPSASTCEIGGQSSRPRSLCSVRSLRLNPLPISPSGCIDCSNHFVLQSFCLPCVFAFPSTTLP